MAIDNVECLRLLLDLGADRTLEDRSRKSAVEAAHSSLEKRIRSKGSVDNHLAAFRVLVDVTYFVTMYDLKPNATITSKQKNG